MDPLKRLFDGIDLNTIEQYARDRQHEHLQLEFKTLNAPAEFTRDDRRNLARALSGFANSEGGVIVWGIEARMADGVDSVTGIPGLPDVCATLARLNSLTGEATSPLMSGIIHEEIPKPDGFGFVKTFVPASDSGPYMAKCGHDRYFKRSGDSFRRMEHFDISDMFGRRPQAVLSLYAEASEDGRSGGPAGGHRSLTIVLGIRNSGRGIARYPSIELSLEPTPPYKLCPFGLDGNRNNGLPPSRSKRRGPGAGAFRGGSDDVVHIDSVLEVTRTSRVDVPIANPRVQDLVIHYRITADGMAPIEGHETLSAAAMLSALGM